MMVPAVLDPRDFPIVKLDHESAPVLTVVIDTEEEFNWGAPHCPRNISVTHIKELHRHDKVLERYNIVPTYVIDFPVASAAAGYEPLRDLLRSRRCEIGSHLHPWVNPPFEEAITPRNSFPGNLPAALEFAKLERLTQTVAERFDVRPTVYRAGRYGIGPHTARSLERLGYETDTSVVPRTSFRQGEGPDFTRWGPEARELSPAILEIPVTAEWVGALAPCEARIRGALSGRLARAARLTGALARLRLLERIRLTPEGLTGADLRRLVTALHRRGHRHFNLIYHSPSIVPGHTPYVRDRAELQAFLSTLCGFLDFFFGELHGTTEPIGVLSRRLRRRRPAGLGAAAAPALAAQQGV
jgi:hypothetical protein